MLPKTYVPDWKEEIIYSDNGPQTLLLAENKKIKIILGGMQAKQEIPPHEATVGIYHFLEGTGWMQVDEEKLKITPRTTIIVPRDSIRGIKAESRLAFFAMRITPCERHSNDGCACNHD
jgi:quercetin dioxygenase-like cupin family protein